MSESSSIPNQTDHQEQPPSEYSNRSIRYQPQPHPSSSSSSSSFDDYSTFHHLQSSNPTYLDSYLDSTSSNTIINQTFEPFQFQSQSSTEPLIFDPLTFDHFSTLFPNFNSNSTSNLQSALSSHETDQHSIQFADPSDHDQLSINPNLLSPKLTNQSDYSNQAYNLSSFIQPDDHQNFNQNQIARLQIQTENQTCSPILQSSPEPQPLIRARKPSNDGSPNPKRKRIEQTSKLNSIGTDGSYNTFLEHSPLISSSSHHPTLIDFRNQECSTPNVNPSVFESNSNHQNQTQTTSEQGGSNLPNNHQYQSQYRYQTISDQETPNQPTQYRSSIDQTSSPNHKPNSSSQANQQQQQHHHLTHDFTKRKDWAKKVMEDVVDLCLLIGLDHRIKFVSSSLNHLTGYHHRDWIDSSLLNWLFDEDDRSNFLREIEESSKDLQKEIKFYSRIRKRDGSCLILEICGHTVLSENENQNSNSIFLSGRKYPTSSSKLSDRIFDLRLENQRLLSSLSLNSEEKITIEKPKEKSLEEKPKKTNKMNKKSSSSNKSNVTFHQSGSGNIKHHGLKSISSENETVSEFVCKDCGTTISPEWRKGPTGPKTLCNACGLRWAKKVKPSNP